MKKFEYTPTKRPFSANLPIITMWGSIMAMLHFFRHEDAASAMWYCLAVVGVAVSAVWYERLAYNRGRKDGSAEVMVLLCNRLGSKEAMAETLGIPKD